MLRGRFPVYKLCQQNKFPSDNQYSNVTAVPHVATVEAIKTKVTEQLTSGVKWEDTIGHLRETGVEQYFEAAPGTQLKAMMRRIDQSGCWKITQGL